MVRRRGPPGVPADYAVGDPAAWSHTELAADAPPPAPYVRHIAQQLHSALEQQPLSGLARQADVTRSTIQDLLAGRVCGKPRRFRTVVGSVFAF